MKHKSLVLLLSASAFAQSLMAETTQVYVNGDDCGTLTTDGLRVSTASGVRTVEINATEGGTVVCGRGGDGVSIAARNDSPPTITSATNQSINVIGNDSYLINWSEEVSLASVGDLSNPNVGSLAYTLNSETNRTITFKPDTNVVKPGFDNNGNPVTFKYTIQQSESTDSATVSLRFDIPADTTDGGDTGAVGQEIPLSGGVFDRSLKPGAYHTYWIKIDPGASDTNFKMTLVNYTSLSGVVQFVDWRVGFSTSVGDTTVDKGDNPLCYLGPGASLSRTFIANSDGQAEDSYYCYFKEGVYYYMTILNTSDQYLGGYRLQFN